MPGRVLPKRDLYNAGTTAGRNIQAWLSSWNPILTFTLTILVSIYLLYLSFSLIWGSILWFRRWRTSRGWTRTEAGEWVRPPPVAPGLGVSRVAAEDEAAGWTDGGRAQEGASYVPYDSPAGATDAAARVLSKYSANKETANWDTLLHMDKMGGPSRGVGERRPDVARGGSWGGSTATLQVEEEDDDGVKKPILDLPSAPPTPSTLYTTRNNPRPLTRKPSMASFTSGMTKWFLPYSAVGTHDDDEEAAKAPLTTTQARTREVKDSVANWSMDTWKSAVGLADRARTGAGSGGRKWGGEGAV